MKPAAPFSIALVLVRAYAVWHIAFILACCYLISQRSYSWLELLGMILTTGFIGGAAFNVAHELIHRRSRADSMLATTLLCSMSYPTFKLEHVGHHHKWVATSADPSSADRGVWLYAHIPKAIVKNVINAARVGYRRSRSFGWSNELVRMLVFQSTTYGLVAFLFGATSALFLFGQSLVAISWLETANYFQHYGLRRGIVDGHPEPVADHHSWDVDQPLLNALWLNLPLHAYHHVDPSLSFDRLFPSKASPKYPVGYVTCTFLAMVPPLWTRFAESLVADHGEHK